MEGKTAMTVWFLWVDTIRRRRFGYAEHLTVAFCYVTVNGPKRKPLD